MMITNTATAATNAAPKNTVGIQRMRLPKGEVVILLKDAVVILLRDAVVILMRDAVVILLKGVAVIREPRLSMGAAATQQTLYPQGEANILPTGAVVIL